MKRFLINYFLFIFIISICTSCLLFREPIANFDKATTKINQSITNVETAKTNLVIAEKKLETNVAAIDDHKQALVFGADLSLRKDPTPSIYSQTAKQFTATELSLYGLPTQEEVDSLNETIEDLVSTNKQLVIEGEKQLDDITKSNKILQIENTNLQNKVFVAESKVASAEAKVLAAQTNLEKVGKQNSLWAQKYTDFIKWLWIIIYVVVGFVILRFITLVLPPPYNTISVIFSVPCSIVVKIIHGIVPEAIALGGWCEKEYKIACEDLVDVIDDFKKTNPAIHPAISAAITNGVSDTSIKVINNAKTAKNITS